MCEVPQGTMYIWNRNWNSQINLYQTVLESTTTHIIIVRRKRIPYSNKWNLFPRSLIRWRIYTISQFPYIGRAIDTALETKDGEIQTIYPKSLFISVLFQRHLFQRRFHFDSITSSICGKNICECIYSLFIWEQYILIALYLNTWFSFLLCFLSFDLCVSRFSTISVQVFLPATQTRWAKTNRYQDTAATQFSSSRSFILLWW